MEQNNYIRSNFLANVPELHCSNKMTISKKTMCTIRAWMKFIKDNINTLSKANSEFLLQKQWLNFNNGKDYFQTFLISIAGCFAMNDCAQLNNPILVYLAVQRLFMEKRDAATIIKVSTRD
ncbi:hypothetical protein T02_3356 [Trichinella nativa]|uniref:Uncharacterized protein n=1 Tax=Trichinella nativa TaxID=6335 RepID=A0A0V1KXB1_9BILA|nr:hypothetical protein T02_3356 [Trichinella nativa]